MEWIDNSLADFWWETETTHINKHKKYKLFLDIKNDWENLRKNLLNIYNKNFHKHFVEHIIHDGNRSVGLLNSYIKDYENNGNLLDTEGWHTRQTMLEYVRQAELIVELYDEISQ